MRLFKQIFVLPIILFLSGCGVKPTKPAANSGTPDDPPRSEVRFGDDENRCLPFTITAIHEKHKPSKDAPFHVEGGDWTFFDCQAEAESKAVFTIGIKSKSSEDGRPIAWGQAVISVNNREAGGRFIELFGKAFQGKVPKLLKQPQALEPLFINTAILGENQNRGEGGGFSDEGGGWTATKWFPENDGLSGEVFFNYNLNKRLGEFSEKDSEYVDDLVAIFASALRDGPRPERTPEDDPNLSLIGPKIGQPRKLLPRIVSFYSFSPQGRFAIYQDRSKIFALPLDDADGATVEIVQFENSPWEMRVVNDDLDLLVQEGIPEMPGLRSSGDPMRIWWVDHKTKQKQLLKGPEKDITLAEAPISPDNRYFGFCQWRDKTDGKGRKEFLYILERETGKVINLDLPDKDLTLVGWKPADAGVRAVIVTNRWGFDEKAASELYLADPVTGKLEIQEHVDGRKEANNLISPDEKHRVQVDKDDFVVTDLVDGKQKRFIFHEDDRRFIGEESIGWISPRYLKFNGQRLALIDVTTMKMSFPASAANKKIGSNTYKFSPDFRWVLYQGEGAEGEGLFLAPVEMPKETETPSMIPLEKILEEIQSSVARKVKEGFLDHEEIVEQVTEAVEDEYQRDDLKPHVARLAAKLCQEHRLAQKTWPTPTDCDKLDAAFASLERQGIVARQNFACCQNCGHAEIGEEIEQASQEREIKGYTFYHMQDTETAAEFGSLYLAYGSVTGKEADSLVVGNAVAEAIRGVGLTVKWNGELNQRICIVDLDWKRRRD
jgi:hypothetical protein